MRSESTSALGQPRLTKPILGEICGMGRNMENKRLLYAIGVSQSAGGVPMGRHINIPTTRTQCIGAWLASPEGTPRGGIVVIQDIYGVTPHIRDVCERLAKAGYTGVAPAFFDHLESDAELAYDRAGTRRGKSLVDELGMQRPLEDVASAAEAI